jgi:hypothetical protein
MTVKQFLLIPVVAILLLTISPAYAAKQGTVQAIIPWDAEGRVFQVGTNTIMFLGSLKGVMYVENAAGEMHEAFVVCPVKQEINLETGSTSAIGRCEITASADSVAYAELSCVGKPGECAGEFTLIEGEGDFAGITGSGKLSVRSPIRTLISDMPSGAVLRVASGLAVVKDLKFNIP